jgi:hypothetical protein
MTKTPATEEMNCCHELKTDPHVFDAVVRGEKTYEIRFNDRDYKVGDNLFLRRTKFDGEGMKKFGAPLIYTGETITVKITHILQGQYGLQDGWAILSFIPAKALDASETVDLDALKRHDGTTNGEDDYCQGWNDCLDHIKTLTGRLKGVGNDQTVR